MTSPLIVFSAADRDEHDIPSWHPENKARIGAVLDGVSAGGLTDATEWREPREATVAELCLAHDPAYVDAVRLFCENGGGDLDPDTMAVPGSWDTSRRATGAVLQAIEALQSEECEHAFAAGRPPGHHALASRAMGFCLFNHVAVGASKLVAAGQRVAIVDWDVHHGNGTQDIFYENPDVLYVSTHESPLYPGTGLLTETGAGAGAGTNMNLPFPAGTRGDTYRAAFDELIGPTIEQFAPDWLIISAGYDAHRDDPLAGLQLSAADYADLARRCASLVPNRRLVVVLEGGYDRNALTMSVGATLGELVGTGYRPEAATTGDIGRPTVIAAKQLWQRD